MPPPRQDGVHNRSGWTCRGCRCSTCHRALLEYGRTLRGVQAVLDGREPAIRVPAEPARRHVRQLLADGRSLRSVARAARVAPSTVHELLDGRRRLALDVDVRLRALT
jgi:hypothetical protein